MVDIELLRRELENKEEEKEEYFEVLKLATKRAKDNLMVV